VASESETLRDGRGLSPLPPPGEIVDYNVLKAPVDIDGSFFVSAIDRASSWPSRAARNRAFRSYISMDKSLVGAENVPQLTATYDTLKTDSRAQYINVAG